MTWPRTARGLGTVDGQQSGIGRLAAGSTTAVQVSGRTGAPLGSMLVLLNVAAVDPSANGFLTLFRCDLPRPNASTLNFRTGATIAAGATVGLDPLGRICV